MARIALRLPGNAPGDFFVDETCIDCDACRRLAPEIFAPDSGQSVVARQPAGEDETLAAEVALIGCPTASIGTETRHDLQRAIDLHPFEIADGVRCCGFTSESSFGAMSWLVVRDTGNVLVDSPRFNEPLAKNLESLGGVNRMVLTHVDDVADHRKFHERFGCERVLHRDDAGRRLQVIEMKPDGEEPVALDDELLMIPVPGHTRGHSVYLWRNRFLFTGDHLAWKPSEQRLYAFRSACWYSWSEQIRSMKRLLDYSFEWVLPGHGHSIRLDPPVMRRELEKTIRWMERIEN